MRIHILAISLALLNSVAHAQKLKPAIESGLWQSINAAVINGEDVNQAVNDMQEELIARQPPEQQEMMREMFAQDDPRISHVCVKENDIAEFSGRDGYYDSIMREEYRQNCRVTREYFNGGTHRLEISCEAGPTIGIIGDGFFEKRIINPRHVVFIHEFDGLNMVHENEDGELDSIDFPSESRVVDEMIWLGPDCDGLSAGIGGAGHAVAQVQIPGIASR